MTIDRPGEVTDELLAALARLLPQLSPGREPPTRRDVTEIVDGQTCSSRATRAARSSGRLGFEQRATNVYVWRPL